MPSSRVLSKFIFAPYVDRIISSTPTDVRALVPKEILYSRIISLIGAPLVYLINEKRLTRELVGETCWDRYNFFNSSAMCEQVTTEMRERFPFMWRRLRGFLDTLSNVISQVRKHLTTDSQELMDVGLIDEGWVIKWVIPAGDFHGRFCNARIEFDNGSSIYFKNRSSDAEDLVQETFRLVNEPGLRSGIRITPFCLNRGAYSWVGSINREPLECQSDEDLFYDAVGRLLFVSYLLGMIDLHHENVIPTNRCLKVIDCETVLTQNVCMPSNLDDATLKANRLLSESVLGTAMLPVGTANDLYGGDISALGNGNYIVQQRVLKNPFRDDIRYVREYVKKEDKRHLPFFLDQHGEEVYVKPNDHIKEIVGGFKSSYRLAMEKSDEIAALVRGTDICSRILYRKTADYQSMLEFVSSIRFSTNYKEKLRDFLKDAINLNKDVINSELWQLMDGAIPAFYASSLSGRIVDSYGHVVGKLAIPSMARCLGRIGSLSSEDMRRQVEFIECSLGVGEKISFNSQRMSHYRPKGEGSLKCALINILNRYKESCIRSDRDGTINWISLGVSDYDQLEAVPLQKGVYSGVAGVGISLLAAYRIIPDGEILNLIQQIYDTCKAEYNRPSKVNTIRNPYSYYMGALGVIEFMLECDQLGIGHGNGRYELSQLVKQYVESDFHDAPTDVISGLAGTCIALCSARTFSPAVVDIVTRFSDHILDSSLSKWLAHRIDTGDNASFAHGASGLATALLNAYVLTARDRFLDGFRLAWNYEECFRNGDSWRDTRRNDGLPSAHWCHGLSGMLLARDNWLKLDRKYDLLTTDERAKLKLEIELLKHGVISYGLRIDNLCLCHGVSGNLSILSQTVPTLDLSREWRYLAAFGVRNGWLCGLNSGIQSMSAMTGLAGIMDSLALQIQGNSQISCLLFPTLTVEEA